MHLLENKLNRSIALFSGDRRSMKEKESTLEYPVIDNPYLAGKEKLVSNRERAGESLENFKDYTQRTKEEDNKEEKVKLLEKKKQLKTLLIPKALQDKVNRDKLRESKNAISPLI